MLPIVGESLPDWGVRCPHCQVSLAGVTEEACPGCGRKLDLIRLLSLHRPVADLGLACEKCGYSLTGLPGTRCPECGDTFDLRDMLEELAQQVDMPDAGWIDPPDHHLPRRPPAFSGRERPLPDFGLYCDECGGILEGADCLICPHCRRPFELPDPGLGDWVPLGDRVPRSLGRRVQNILYAAEIPYVMDDPTMKELFTGIEMPFLSTRIRVPREFFFDALYALAEATHPPPECVRETWVCANCGNQVPAGFEVCWKCGEPHPGLAEA